MKLNRMTARRLARTLTQHSPVIPLVIIVVLSGMILFVDGQRELSAGPTPTLSALQPWGP